MTSEITLSIWLFLLLVLVSGLAILDRIFIPSVRWFLRRRVNRVLNEISTRLDIEIKPFQLTKRRVLIDRLAYDPKVMEAMQVYAQEHNMPREVAQAKAVTYAKVEGVVKDLDSGKVIKNALITVEGCKKSAMTNSAGKFYLDIPAGTANMQITKRGYQTLQSEISLTTEKKTSLKISLEAEKKAEVKPVAGISAG